MTDGSDAPTMDPAGVVHGSDSPSSSGIVLRVVVSGLEAMLAVVLTLFGVIAATFCDGDETGTGICDGSSPRETVMLVAVLLFGAVLAGGAVGSVFSPALDRHRIRYWVPAGALLLVVGVAASVGR
jgi:hypothetical protein